jgi:P4 family phage/plasmid primase-like protien
MMGSPAFPRLSPCFSSPFPGEGFLSFDPTMSWSTEVLERIGLLAEDRIYSSPGRLSAAARRDDPRLAVERRRLLKQLLEIRRGVRDEEDAYCVLRDREAPHSTSPLLAVAGEFPDNLWRVDRYGNPVADPSGFVLWIAAQAAFVSPTDTFCGSGFELLRYSDGMYVEGGKAFVHAQVERAHRSRGLTAHHGIGDEVARGVARRSMVDRGRLNSAEFLNLANGALNLKSGSLERHSPALRFTYRLQTRLDPSATCPTFVRFLEEVLPREKDRREVQKLFGYLFSPGNLYQIAHLFVGEGCNGKSTLIGVMVDLLGPENVSAETLQSLNENKFASAKLYGKLLNAFADLPSNPLKQSSTFKTLTGGDQVRAELKFGAIFYFTNSAKLVFSANELPEVNDRTMAFWRRWQLIRLDRNLTGREDRKLPEKLRAELPGILNWALDGRRLLEADEGFDPDLSGEGLKAEWMRRSDTLGWFCSEQLESEPAGWVPKEELYQAYVEFCASNKASAKGQEQVGKELPRHHPQVRTEKRRLAQGELQVRGWRGLRLRWSVPASPASPGLVAPPEAGEPGEAGKGHLSGSPVPILKTSTGGD